MTEATPAIDRDDTAQNRSRSVAVVAIMAAIAISLAATAMVFSVAAGTTETANLGATGVLSEASLSAAAAARNGVVQAQLIAEANQLGVATAEELDRALLQAETASAELESRVGRLLAEGDEPGLSPSIRSHADGLRASISTAVALMASGDTPGAGQVIEDEIDVNYRRLAAQLATERDSAMARVTLAGEDAGRLADAARFLVVLLVPLAVLLAYRRRVKLEQIQRELEHELEKQHAVSKTKDEFIANLSHELRTPLTAIYGFSLELIEPERPKNPAFEQELATYIASESADLSRMVEDILAAASADQEGLSISMGTVDPVKEIDSVLDPQRATGAKVESDLAPGQITCDPLRFRQIIRNLVSNALRHGGPNARVVGRSERGVYTVEVRDDGAGIPASLEERLFTRFIHQGDEPLLTGSVGLGLAIARLLTTKTGGQISYRRENEETVFAVSFPLAAGEFRHADGFRRLGPRRHHAKDHDGERLTRPPRKPDLKNFTAPHPTSPYDQGE